MKKSKFQAISLFSGAGGLDIGCKLAGVDVKVAIDNDSDATETLKLNNQFKTTTVLKEDIKNFNPKKVEKYLNGKKIILIGGPPCQPFSKNGYWVKNENRKSNEDPRNCIQNYFDFVKNLNPNGFLLENVESMLHPTNRKAVDYILYKSKKLGYNLKMIKTNALDYGVPQKRKRIFCRIAKRFYFG